MINIAICDDIEIEREKVYIEVNNYFLKVGKLCRIVKFSHGDELLKSISEENLFDIVLLDIEMPDLNGFALTLNLKNKLPGALVILVTSYQKYVYKSFEVQPYRFIPKSMINDMLPQALRDSIRHIENLSKKEIVIRNSTKIVKMQVKNIIYIYHVGKYSYIKKNDGNEEKVRRSLKELYEELMDSDFEMIERGYLCNFANIIKIEDRFAYMSNGEKLQISGDRLTEVKNKLLAYCKRNGGV